MMEMDGQTQLQIGRHIQLVMLMLFLMTQLNGVIATATVSEITQVEMIRMNALENMGLHLSIE